MQSDELLVYAMSIVLAVSEQRLRRSESEPGSCVTIPAVRVRALEAHIEREHPGVLAMARRIERDV
jgi:hypothetical protein